MDWIPVPERFVLGYRVFVQNTSLTVFIPWNQQTFAHVGGLQSNTTYIISVSPLHGLTDKETPVENEESIMITTKPELGKQFLGDSRYQTVIKM